MRIGIDISSLQGPHRMRGIGYVAANFVKNIPKDTKDTFVLYGEKNAPLSIETVIGELDLGHIKYEVHIIESMPLREDLPGKLKYFSKAKKRIRELIYYSLGDAGFKSAKSLDAFLQLDQSKPLPRLRFGAHLYFIAYDIIPYVLEADYLWSFRTAQQHGLSRKAALKCSIRRALYITKIRLNSYRSTGIFTISKTTQLDFEKYVKTPHRKTIPLTLGLSVLSHKKSYHDGSVNRYHETSWGYLPHQESLKDERFLLFVGGADHRRRLDDLVTAFNHLRASGLDIKLVLSGDSMQGPRNIATHSIQEALVNSAYADDIYYVGFSDDKTRDWLYENALVFVFPSVYEGFGLPVLEAMSYGTPVICYENNTVKEVASSIPFYAKDALDIKNNIINIIKSPSELLAKRTEEGVRQAAKYSWVKASKSILSHINQK